MAIPLCRKDGTEGTATIKFEYENTTSKFYGCIVKNDNDLCEFIRDHIKPSADRNLFSKDNTKYFFYMNFEETITKATSFTVTCYRFSTGKPKKKRKRSFSQKDFVKVQEHIFVPCNFENFNGSKFLETHSKKLLVAQTLNTTDTTNIELLSLVQDNKNVLSFKSIPLTVNGQTFKVPEEDYQNLVNAGPVLKDGTLVGSFEKKTNNEIFISIFEMTSASGTDGGFPGRETGQAAGTQPPTPGGGTEQAADTQPPTPGGGTGQAADTQPPTPGGGIGQQTVDPKDDQKLEKPVKESEDKKKEEYEFTPLLSSEEKDSLPGEGNDKQGQEHDRPYQCNEKFSKQEINAGASGSCFHPTDSYEGHVQQQPTTKNIKLASQDQQKATNEEKELLTVPLKLGPSSNYEENLPSPIQVSRSDSDDGYIFSHLEEIKKDLKDGQLKDNLSWKKNIGKYRRFLLYVAQNATWKWQKIGGMLDIKHNKLDSLRCDYQSEGNAEQTYQMLVYWTQSDKNPSLEKLVVALIDTELVEVANKVSDMITESTNRGGKTVTEQLLNKITDDVKDVWKFLGRYLGIDESTIHSIKMDNRDNTREQARQMFVKWKQSNGRRATTGVLINALRDVRKSNVVTNVQVWERQTQLF